MITEIEDYFSRGCGRCPRFATVDCSTRRWAEGLARLRTLSRAAGLEETVRWGHPCYRHAERNVAILGAFREDFRLSFFNAGLLRDPEGLLERAGPNSRHADLVRFRAAADVERLAPALSAYLAEAMDLAARGVTQPRTAGEAELPDDLVEALDADPELAEGFAVLTPGRRRSYVIALSSAKQPATRLRRIAGFRDRILAGKGATER